MTKTVSSVARELIKANPTMKNEDIAKMVIESFAGEREVKTTAACIAWYKSKDKKDAKDNPVKEVRTVAKIEEEIALLQMELEELKEAEAKKLVDEEAELIAKLAKIQEIKEAKAKEEQQEEETV